MARYYDRQGNPIDMAEWAGLIEGSAQAGGRQRYQIVQQDYLEGGRLLSTVWLGLDHRHFGDGPPLIFETMYFGPHEEREVFGRLHQVRPELLFPWEGESTTQLRWSTEEEAREGHARILASLRPT